MLWKHSVFYFLPPHKCRPYTLIAVIREKWFLGGASDIVSSRSNGSRCYPRASSVVRGQSSRWLMVVGGDKNRETRNRMTGQIPERTATAPFTPVLCSHRKLRSGTCANFEMELCTKSDAIIGLFGLMELLGVIAIQERGAQPSNIKRGLCERNFILVTQSILLS